MKVQCDGLDKKEERVKARNMKVELEKEVRKLKDENKSLYFEFSCYYDFHIVMSSGLLEIHKELELLQPKIGNDLQLNEACLKTFAEKVGERPENEVTIISRQIFARLSEICFQMRRSLEEQKAVNIELSGYVDSVLSNIMEKYPNVLERLK